MAAMRVSRTVAVATGLALALSLYSCTVTTDLSGAIVGKVMVAGSSTPIPGAVVECEGLAAVSPRKCAKTRARSQGSTGLVRKSLIPASRQRCL